MTRIPIASQLPSFPNLLLQDADRVRELDVKLECPAIRAPDENLHLTPRRGVGLLRLLLLLLLRVVGLRFLLLGGSGRAESRPESALGHVQQPRREALLRSQRLLVLRENGVELRVRLGLRSVGPLHDLLLAPGQPLAARRLGLDRLVLLGLPRELLGVDLTAPLALGVARAVALRLPPLRVLDDELLLALARVAEPEALAQSAALVRREEVDDAHDAAVRAPEAGRLAADL
mmetsp:Transcript_34956/g.118430  ORF Transcript_34956/g.118430 Transcript_34956/m.118430 type:complete len:232 (-) Transcript_34956:198-893(-)